MSTGWLISLGTIALVVMMALLWIAQQRHRDAGVVDVGWAAGLGLLAIWYGLAGGGAWPHRALIGALGGVWGMRLALHLLFDRVIGKPEDGRYAALREYWGARASANFFWFFQAQALLAVILSAPFLLACLNRRPTITGLEWLGLVLWIVGICGEAIADRQLAAFRNRPENKGRTCREGLWRYSRHPNYFFEWVIWCGYGAIALAAPHGWIGLLSPALMLVLILKVTGIPYTEARALKTRGDDYRDYQRTTSVFVPWPPRKEAP